jgi:asparagine synthase (glutamine-hydrolysing)
MCGLSAIVDFEPRGDLLATLMRMHDQVPHRGPDGEGFAVIDQRGTAVRATTAQEMRARADSRPLCAGLAFRWLKILDPSELAAQPVASSDGSVWLIFNGEIYNHPALREQLRVHGHEFRSSGDAEVLIAAYLEWGVGMFSRLTGMWSMILLDARSRTLLIARDRFGIKPLYYCRIGSRLLFASEIKQLIAAGAKPAANTAAVARFIRGNRPEPHQTFFSAIHGQPPATYAQIRLDDAAQVLPFTTYWRLPQAPERRAAVSLERATSALDAALADSVADHLLGPAPTGHLISGGLDSSLVAALAARNYAREGRTGKGFSMVLERGSLHDESAFIDRVASLLRFQSHKVEFSAAWLKENIDRISRTQEEPVPGPALAGQFLVFELASRSGVRVILDGQGADELFAGYLRHQSVYLKHCATRHALGTLVLEGIAVSIRNPRMLPRAVGSMIRSRWRGRFPGASSAAASIFRLPSPADDDGPKTLYDALSADVSRGNLPAVLALTDRNAMAHSIEARVPYVDHRIVELAFGLPDAHKLGLGLRKRILRRVAARYLPPQITHRSDRIGFGAPTAEWLRREFRQELSALHLDSVLSESAIVEPRALASFIEAFLSGDQPDAGTAWRLFAVARWAKVHSLSTL